MDRRGFLSFIPALGAAPFIGQAFKKTEQGILLLEPEAKPIKIIPYAQLLNKDIEVRFYKDGVQMPMTGWLQSIEINRREETSCYDSDRFVWHDVTFTGNVHPTNLNDILF